MGTWRERRDEDDCERDEGQEVLERAPQGLHLAGLERRPCTAGTAGTAGSSEGRTGATSAATIKRLLHPVSTHDASHH